MYVEYDKWRGTVAYWMLKTNPPAYWPGPSSCVWIVPGTVDVEGNILIKSAEVPK